MRLVSSLTNRIFLACTVVAVLSLGVVFAFVNARAIAAAEAQLRAGLVESGELVDEHRATVTDTFTRLARLIADLPKLKAAVETADPPTIQPLADDYARQMRADVLILSSPRGQVLASVGERVDDLPGGLGPVYAEDEITTFLPHGRGLLQLVSVPLVLEGDLPVVLGRLTAGFFLDDAMAAQFRDLTGSEVAFAVDGRIVASTLTPRGRDGALAVLASSEVGRVTLDDEEFLALSRPLAGAGVAAASASPAAIILRSRTERLRFLNTIRNGFIAALVLTVLLATLLSYAVARTMTRPLAAVTTAMRDMAATGDLTRRVSLASGAWGDEDARLLASTFNTMTESIERFQKEAAQRERLSALGRLSTVIAHEIRNPLMIIKASLPSLRREHASVSERREAVADIDEETTRLNRIVSEVLDFARPIRYDLTEADLHGICRASVAAAWAGADPAEVALDFDDTVPPLVTDPERLRTVLVNLLTNARHAVTANAVAATGTHGPFQLKAEDASSPPDGTPVTLTTRRNGDRVTIAIRDRGVGIAPEDIAHIFDPYFTTRRAGTGLGLPIARNIIDGLGGSLSVTSRAGDGTEIRVDLPIVARA